MRLAAEMRSAIEEDKKVNVVTSKRLQHALVTSAQVRLKTLLEA